MGVFPYIGTFIFHFYWKRYGILHILHGFEEKHSAKLYVRLFSKMLKTYFSYYRDSHNTHTNGIIESYCATTVLIKKKMGTVVKGS